ncbi:hypothetical protein [Streptomyces sp. NPDC085596]|uniref:hypothetical protein n=1 Tax=Streptomyces sp. NPDC085596 TaxID=3365731 RepID=UPI0037CE909D
MGTSSQIRSVIPLHQSPQAHVYVDRDGDTWVGTGWTDGGDLLLACPKPLNPADAGEGESFPWTLAQVRQAFGPLTEAVAVPEMVRAEDVEEQALAAVDARMVAEFGPVMADWSPQQRDAYLGEIAAVHAQFAPQGVAA